VKTVYLDYNATTPLDPQVRDVMLPFLGEVFGNPSSIHHVGRRARVLLDDARERTSKVLKCRPGEVIFTSGGTEANNLAIFGTARLLRHKGKHLITTTIEHHAVLNCFDYLEKEEGFSVTRLPVDGAGSISTASLAREIRPDTTLVSIMAANNEIGTVQPVAELGALCQERGVRFHTDAVQWFGKEPLISIHQFNADLVSICAHKFHGPKGAGALFIRSPLHPDPIIFGGGHENERRAGTENLAGIIGFTVALERFVREPVFSRTQLEPLAARLVGLVDATSGCHLVTPRGNRLANTIAFVVDDTDSLALLAGLDLEGICASSGSACSVGSLEPSHVVTALGLAPALANALVRFSLGRETTVEDIERVEQVLPVVARRAQRPQQRTKTS
jgi:cysteine desulfurase